MGLPITASCDLAWNRTRVCSDASSTEMECLRPLSNSGGPWDTLLSLRPHLGQMARGRGLDNTGGHFSLQSWEGLWLWNDGSRFSYQNCGQGQPDNHNYGAVNDNTNGREHCMEMNYGGDRGLNDAPCRIQRPFMCSRKM
ncbi:uncharacterized protein ACWYII_027526 isoform 1-T2 [Salvelinus alpinus]|uniref:galactose-specific lectin nattectin-like n=1 Tax=Salvelinus sp. IW2-2015 TaxID=2691554 RepID=UPI0038D42C2B